jgi:uncharacterized membrane-anchored protein
MLTKKLLRPEWKMDEVTAELSARPFPKFDLPTNVFRVCVRGRDAFSSVKDVISDLLPDIDWDIAQQGKLIYATSNNVSINIEPHTEFTSVTLIKHSDEEESLASFLPDGWSEKILGDIVVAVDCQCRPRSSVPTVEFPCASKFEDGLAHAYFSFKVGENGHTQILLDFDASASQRNIGRIALQVIEIETYRSFAALGLPHARQIQDRLWEIADMIPRDPIRVEQETGASITETERKAAEGRFEILSEIASELEEIWQKTSFRFNACQAYWSIVVTRLTSLKEEAVDSRLTIGMFLERRLQPAIATYQSTAGQRRDLAQQVDNMATLLQTRIELALQTQNAELLASLNKSAERQLRLQQTVEGISVVAISYYLVGLLKEPLPWVLNFYPDLDVELTRVILVIATVPVVWFLLRKILFPRH